MIKKYFSIFVIVNMLILVVLLLLNLYKVAHSKEAEPSVETSVVPSIEGTAVAKLKNTSAQVIAYIDTKGLENKIVLDYGDTADYENRVYMVQRYPNIKEKQHIYIANLKLLETGTTYHYRITVITETVVVVSEDKTFNTTKDESL